MTKIDSSLGTFQSAVDAFGKNSEKGGEIARVEGGARMRISGLPDSISSLPARALMKFSEVLYSISRQEVPAGRCPFSAQEVHLLNRAMTSAYAELPDTDAKRAFLNDVANDPRLRIVADLAQGRATTNDVPLRQAAEAFMQARAALFQQGADAGQRELDARAEELKRAIVGLGGRPPSPQSSAGTRAPLTPPTGGGVGLKR